MPGRDIKCVSFSLSQKTIPLCLFKILHSYGIFHTFTEQLDLVISYDGESDL